MLGSFSSMGPKSVQLHITVGHHFTAPARMAIKLALDFYYGMVPMAARWTDAVGQHSTAQA